MHKKLFILFILLGLFSGFDIYGQQPSTLSTGLFPTIDHSGKIYNKLGYSLYYFGAFPLVHFPQPAINEDAGFLLLYLENSLGLRLDSAFSIKAAYVFQREHVSEQFHTDEHRAHIQINWQTMVGAGTLQSRIRSDQRFISPSSETTTRYRQRIRFLLGYQHPIKNTRSYFSLYEEGFINFGNVPTQFAENWAAAAYGVKLNKTHSIEAGPLYITWNTGGKSWYHQYYLQLTWVSQIK